MSAERASSGPAAKEKREARDINNPEPGYFLVRLVRGGPFVPARITHEAARDPETDEPLDRSPLWACWINGKLVKAASPDWMHAGVENIWIFGRRITEDEYWARRDAPPELPDAPAMAADKPIDLITSPLPF